jgi:hypothetical protein
VGISDDSLTQVAVFDPARDRWGCYAVKEEDEDEELTIRVKRVFSIKFIYESYDLGM